MRILDVRTNNRKKVFEIDTTEGRFSFPYARLDTPPRAKDRVAEVYVDAELANEAITYRLESGAEDAVHIEQVLDYHGNAEYLTDLLIYRLTLEARQAVAESAIAGRELTRRLDTSASQFYRLLDPTNTRKSLGQLLTLLHVLGYRVEFALRPLGSSPDM